MFSKCNERDCHTNKVVKIYIKIKTSLQVLIDYTKQLVYVWVFLYFLNEMR